MLHLLDCRFNLLRKEADRSALLDTTRWAVTECADADLGDLRRTQRLVARAPARAQRPGAALPEACGRGAMRQAASRFVANEDIAPDEIRQSPIEATSSRLNKGPLVLAVPETTEAHWTH
jgi:Transposase DNA-binding